MTELMTFSPALALARYATPRNADLATLGPLVDATMTALGWPPMPWQSQVNAVAGEMRDDGTFRYTTVIVTTPRQAGKTTLLGGKNIQRCMMWPDYRAWYTAQTGLAARDVWKEWADALARTMPNRWAFRRSAGQETARFKVTNSWLRAFPPTPDSLHSKQSDSVDADELWNATVESADALMQAVVPTQATRPRRQLWLISTAGDINSTWWKSKIIMGRASLGDPNSEVAYFEWSTPEDEPWDSPDTWAKYHPAYGHTQNERSFRNAIQQMGEVEFRRAYLNQWPTAEASWREAWPDLITSEQIPEKARFYIAADGPTNHRHASITAAAALPDGRIVVEVIDSRPGIEWLKPRLIELTRKHRTPILIQRNGPLGFIHDDLEKSGIRMAGLTNAQYSDAAASFTTMIMSGKICHNDDPRLNAAAGVAQLRTIGDRTTWRRSDTSVDISPFVAASLAAWQAANPPTRPKVRA